jgi:hypothetical protein
MWEARMVPVDPRPAWFEFLDEHLRARMTPTISASDWDVPSRECDGWAGEAGGSPQSRRAVALARSTSAPASTVCGPGRGLIGAGLC